MASRHKRARHGPASRFRAAPPLTINGGATRRVGHRGRTMVVGLMLVIGGVITIELGSAP